VDSDGIARAALVYALRQGWTEHERRDLADAKASVAEIIGAYQGKVPDDLAKHYGDEFEDLA
jgi:hypothetical protein